MPDNLVSMVSYRGVDSVREAIENCEGFAGLKSGAKVLIKPNLVGWDSQGPYPPWGVLTTSRVMEGLCAVLKDAGAGEIIIIAVDSMDARIAIWERLRYNPSVGQDTGAIIPFSSPRGGRDIPRRGLR